MQGSGKWLRLTQDRCEKNKPETHTEKEELIARQITGSRNLDNSWSRRRNVSRGAEDVLAQEAGLLLRPVTLLQNNLTAVATTVALAGYRG